MTPTRTAPRQPRQDCIPARGRTTSREVGRMNKTEQRYADEVLTPLQRAGEILSWKFEALKLRLADRTFYDTDFFVQLPCGLIEIHEVKGFMEDDAAVKLKVAADQFPFTFKLIRLKNKAWTVEEV